MERERGVVTLPTNYLSLPLGAPFISSRVWNVVKEIFQKQLILWKREHLSKREKITLIKKRFFYLANLLHIIICHPKKGEVKAEKDSKGFLLRERTLVKRSHMVNWLIICLDKR